MHRTRIAYIRGGGGGEEEEEEDQIMFEMGRIVIMIGG